MEQFESYKVFLGELGTEKEMIYELPEDMRKNYHKGDLIAWDDDVYKIKQVLYDYENKEYALFVVPYNWP